MKYRYSGIDRSARKVDGEIEATSENDVRQRLRQMNIRPVRIIAQGGSGGGAGKTDLLQSLTGMSFNVPKASEFSAFIRQLATMQSAGIPIVQSLGVLADQVENRGFGAALGDVKRAIQEGTSFADALRRYPKIFDNVFVNLVMAGEVSGALDRVLNRLAVHYEKSSNLRRKVQSALVYPALVIVLVFGVIIIMLWKVVPVFAKMFSQQGKDLPAETKMIMAASDFVQQRWYIIFLGIGGTIFGAIKAYNDPAIRKVIDPITLKMPIFGDLFRKIGIARFARTLGTMVQAGVPILDALEITGRVAGNWAIESAIEGTRKSISEGHSIAEPLERAGVFPKMSVSMIAIGEQTGALDAMLEKIAEFYEEEVDAKVTSLSSILEPMLIVIVGVVVAGILVPMYMPIFKMAETFTN